MTLVLIVALLLPPCDAAWQVVLLTPDESRVAVAEQATQQALAWWQAQGMPVPAIGAVTVAPLPPDALESPPVFGERTIVVLDTPGLIFGRNLGIAAPGRVWAVLTPDLAVTLTHELGHALYGLPNEAGCEAIDIMCPLTAEAAYVAGFAGCETLSALGRPCHTVALPEVIYV